MDRGVMLLDGLNVDSRNRGPGSHDNPRRGGLLVNAPVIIGRNVGLLNGDRPTARRNVVERVRTVRRGGGAQTA